MVSNSRSIGQSSIPRSASIASTVNTIYICVGLLSIVFHNIRVECVDGHFHSNFTGWRSMGTHNISAFSPCISTCGNIHSHSPFKLLHKLVWKSVDKLSKKNLIFCSQSFIHPSKYALIGAASQLGGVMRMTLSLTAILIETTGNVSFSLPLIVTFICAKWTGDLFTEGIYDTQIAVSKVFCWFVCTFLEDNTRSTPCCMAIYIYMYIYEVRTRVYFTVHNVNIE